MLSVIRFKSPSCVSLIFSVAASELPNLNTISVWLLSAAKVLSASATIDAATVIENLQTSYIVGKGYIDKVVEKSKDLITDDDNLSQDDYMYDTYEELMNMEYFKSPKCFSYTCGNRYAFSHFI